MPAQYLDEYLRELKRDGEAVFRAHYGAHVLILTKAGGELQDRNDANEATVMASSSGWRLQELSLLNRVFPIVKGPFAPPGPVTLGRSDSSDVAVPEESISKRHCTFEFGPDGARVIDTGSTNGTSVSGKPLAPHEPHLLVGGETLDIGNFAFLFHTPDTFVAYLRSLGPAP
jgi:hypothetical protein